MGDRSPVAEAEIGSIHDPTSQVFHVDGIIVRGVRGKAVADLTELLGSDFYKRIVQVGDCVSSSLLQPTPDLPGGFDAALSHPRLAPVTFPYEWTFSMLRDAALLHLRIVREAVRAGFTTKDATPFNVQFVGSRPQFIDIGSFERLDPGSPWLGYRQFCDLFLNPLLIQAYTGVSARQLLRGSVRGVTPDATLRTLPLRARRRPGIFTNVSLHARLQRRYASADGDVVGDMRAAGMGPRVLDNQLRRLEALVESLRWRQAASTWSDYSIREHYGEADIARKREFVGEVAATQRWKLALDLGANDGAFVEPLRPHVDRIVAVDGDELVVDAYYQSLRQSDDRQVTPLCIDLADPGGGVGWDGRQRSGALERLSADLLLALALMHHVVIGDSVPMRSFISTLAALAPEVVLELPLPDDPKVKRLLRNKAGQPSQPYGEDVLVASLDGLFEVVRSELLPSGLRRMFHLRRLG